MSFAPALNVSFFAPDKAFLPPRKKPVRRALLPPPPPPPDGAPGNSLMAQVTRRLLALDPIAFMIGLLLTIGAGAVALWSVMGLFLPL